MEEHPAESPTNLRGWMPSLTISERSVQVKGPPYPGPRTWKALLVKSNNRPVTGGIPAGQMADESLVSLPNGNVIITL